MSLMVDELIAGGDVKAISDATKALTSLTELAQIKELSETASEGTIKTVADLYKYMEDHGFHFNYYDQVDRDIVDKTLKDIQDSIRTNLNNAVGLDVTLQTVKENYLRGLEEEKASQAAAETPLTGGSVDSEGINQRTPSQEIAAIEATLDDPGDTELNQQLTEEEIIFED